MSSFVAPTDELLDLSEVKAPDSRERPYTNDEIRELIDAIEVVEVVSHGGDGTTPLRLHRDDGTSVEVKQIAEDETDAPPHDDSAEMERYGCAFNITGTPSLRGIPVVITFTPDPATEPDAPPRYSRSVSFDSRGRVTYLPPVLVPPVDQDAPSQDSSEQNMNTTSQTTTWVIPIPESSTRRLDLPVNVTSIIPPTVEAGPSTIAPGYNTTGRTLRHIPGTIPNSKKRTRDEQSDEEEALRPTRKSRTAQAISANAAIASSVSTSTLAKTPQRRSARIAAINESATLPWANDSVSISSPRCLGSRRLGKVLKIAKTALKKKKF